MTRPLALGLVLAACSCTRREPAPATKLVLPGDDKVLAEVNGAKITAYDVTLTARSTFSEATAAGLDAAAKKKVLQSLVSSRAIAQKREAELTATQRAELERKVAAFREDELVRQYVATHGQVQPVTSEMVASYYHDHPERFGAVTTRSYELLASTRELTDAERAPLLAALANPGAHEDWAAWVRELQKKHQPVAYQRGEGSDAALHPSLRSLVQRVPLGASSALTFIAGRAYLVHPLAETRSEPRPLAEVSGEIRKSLVPVQLTKSVAQASELALKDAKVTYR
jgi:hypothetical protein